MDTRNLHEFTALQFLTILHFYYETNKNETSVIFFGECEFELHVGVHLFIKLQSEHLKTIHLLKSYPNLIVHTKQRYLYKLTNETIFSFDILRDLWKLHKGFKRIEILKCNIVFERTTPKLLSDLCLEVIDENNVSLPNYNLNVLKRMGLNDSLGKYL